MTIIHINVATQFARDIYTLVEVDSGGLLNVTTHDPCKVFVIHKLVRSGAESTIKVVIALTLNKV